MANRVEKVGAMSYDNLFAKADGDVMTGSGVIASGAGVLSRGTVMAMDGGKLVVMNTGKTPYGILCDDVDASAADTVAEVYLSGCFNKGALIVAEGYELTAADVQELRKGGIFVENCVN